jgi:tetratricopeptide (TPR) repeat protein
MEELTHYTVNRRHTFITVLGITVLAFLVLISVASATPNSTNWFDKGLENEIKASEKAIELNPQNTDAWRLKGNYLTRQKKFDEAMKVYDKIIELNGKGIALTKIQPQSLGASLAWTSKGDVLEQLGKYDDAMKAYDKAIEIDPRDFAAWNGKGRALDQLNKHEEAIKAYEKAKEIVSRA